MRTPKPCSAVLAKALVERFPERAERLPEIVAVHAGVWMRDPPRAARSLIQLGEIRRVLERLREAETLAEKLNDDDRRGRVCAFVTNVHGQVGALDAPLAWGSRALAIAHRLGNPELRILRPHTS
jgi:hypothetical protein